MHGSRQIFQPLDLDGPLGPGPSHRHHVPVQNGFLKLQPAVLLAGGDQQRRALAIGVVEHAHCVAQPTADVQVHHAQLARGHGVTIGHGHHRHFLQAENVLEAIVAH
jgi:hypothetical protein